MAAGAARATAGRDRPPEHRPIASYAKAERGALPDAVLGADRFQLVALAKNNVHRVRQRVTRESCGQRGRKADPAWAARRRLLTEHERLQHVARYTLESCLCQIARKPLSRKGCHATACISVP